MTQNSPSKQPKRLAAWNAEKQAAYRARNADEVCVFHVLLDASPSMQSHAPALRRAYDLYLGWLQTHANPMSLVELGCFSDALIQYYPFPLGEAQPLTKAVYDPMQGDGTALYEALLRTVECDQAGTLPGQHIVIVFTDGLDNRSYVSATEVAARLSALQQTHGWLAVFLGAFPEALEEGLSLGFTAGNCLVFTADQIPEAFHALTIATAKYLTAPAQERKLLAAGGIF
jgi:hypothetical protein